MPPHLARSLPLLLVALPALADEPPPGARSIHEVERELHRHEPMVPRAVPPRDQPERAAARSVRRIVYGYLPYWVKNLATIRWDALTHVAWFSVDVDELGNVTDRNGWPDTATVEAAHAAGVRVDLTFTLFSGSKILALCQDPARRANAIKNMIDEMVAGGADGISVDFEGLIDGTRDGFNAFIAELRAALEARGLKDAGISIAGPSVNWSGSDGLPEFDLDRLLDSADIYFIMGYGYFWSGSGRAGPTGMIRVDDYWRPYQTRSMLRTLADTSASIPDAKRGRIVHGVPYYGREWITATGERGATVVDHVGSVTYAAARRDLDGGRVRQWDSGVDNAWYVWQDAGAWHQVYYDDEDSLAAKYRLALDQGIGGVGIWALNYDGAHPELWDTLEAVLGEEPPTPPGHRLDPLPIAKFPFHDERDLKDGPGSYFNFYSCSAETPEYGREWVYAIEVCAPGTISARVPKYERVDPDLHLLSAADQRACIARDHSDLSHAVQPGRYLLVVDTWVDDLVTTEGPYALDVDFVPSGAGCADDERCAAGACVCADDTRTRCGGGCVDTRADPEHCGGCGRRCEAGGACVDGACVAPPTMPMAPAVEGGCSCRVGERSSGRTAAPLPLLLLAGVALALARRRRSA